MANDDSNLLPERTIAPNIVVRGVEQAIRFYQNAFGATLLFRKEQADGSLQHAQMQIGNSFFIVSEETFPGTQAETASPGKLGGTSVSFEIFVDNLDLAFDRAINAGGRALTVSSGDVHFGDHAKVVADPFGHVWTLSTFLDDGGALCI